jgi:hypothetical protein
MTDQEFIQTIANEFKIPLQDLTNITSDLRTWKNKVPEKTEFKSVERKRSEDLIRILESPDFKVTAIHIETPNGNIDIPEGYSFFHVFNRPIELFRGKVLNDMNKADKQRTNYINTWIERQIFRYFTILSQSHNIGKFNFQAIIGLYFCHFNIYARMPIMTRDQWDKNKKGATYYHYLNSIVKSLHKKYVKELASLKM